MIFKCKKCGNGEAINFRKALGNFMKIKFLFLCRECKEIELWKIENREKFLFDDAGRYYEYNVKGNSMGLELWIDRVSKDEKKLVKLKMVDGSEINLFPIEFDNDYLWCFNDVYDPAINFGMHQKGQTKIRIPINKIDKLTIAYVYDNYDAPEVSEPVYGYKGVTLCDGILGNHRYIYEIGIPYQEEKRNPYITDYQDVYSHFCSNMEDVLFRWDRDYISSTIQSSKGIQNSDTRLFKVKCEGHCFKTTQKGWVSNNLTLIEEVSQSEIIKYFSSKPKLIQKLNRENRISENGENIWEQYINTKVRPYIKLIEQKEIQKMFIENCFHRKMEGCEDQLEDFDIRSCDECKYSDYNENHYNYLILRSQILSHNFDETSEYYQQLVLKKVERELNAIHQLIKISIM